MPRRAYFVFHLEIIVQGRFVYLETSVSMPRRAYFVFHHPGRWAELSHQELCFNAPKGLFCISPNRKGEKWTKIIQCFNAPKGLFCISPQQWQPYVTLNLCFNAPKGLFCISPLRTLPSDGLAERCFNAPKGLFCISPGVKIKWKQMNCFKVSMPRRAYFVFHPGKPIPIKRQHDTFQCPEGLILYFTVT